MAEQEQNNERQSAASKEAELLEYWDQQKIFEKSLKKNEANAPYVFYDGPPFATGLPHYGHILGSTAKDVFGRYWTMKGRFVRRRWGWDCHGLPIEQLVEQELGISGKKEIEKIGVDTFNEKCRTDVLRYVEEWRKTVRRMARFVDFDDSYKTMDSTYMESVWWALKQTWDKGLVYEGRKVLMYCPRCETPVSNFEVASDNSYDDVSEESVYVKAEVLNSKFDEKTYLLAWTTTPWTLPGNVAMAVGSDIDYVVVKPSKQDLESGIEDALYILAKARVEVLFNIPEVKKELKGSELVGISYKQLFDVPVLQSDKSFKVYTADFVTTEDGTGIVHTAVMYGEEDYELGLKVGLPAVQLLNAQGVFNEQATEFLRGKFYKDTEPEIIEALELNKTLFKKEVYTHSVPFCWRCGTRLYYSALPSWFINIQKIKPRLIELNEKINWFPEHLKEGRFKKGLESAPDWNISRNRYWATPLPFWKCSSKNCGRSVCVGSLKELAEKAVNYSEVYKTENILEVDLHRPYIDKVKMQCGVCGNDMFRVPEVVDCWVESASMPFAEFHYPFENKEQVEKRRPAQFVAEYINQTRAWFYVMHVMSTILWDQAPFENVVTSGVVLAEDGQKMSKSKKNFPDPWIIFDKYGADALRFYLMSSPVMQGENLFFSEKDLDEIYKKITILLGNVHSFLRMYSSEKVEDSTVVPVSSNVLDKWILAVLKELQLEVTKQMDLYDTVRATKPVLKFINDLSTWYVRRSRDRFKGNDEQAKTSLKVLSYVLVELSKLLAPVMPFISETIYRDLTGNESVHLSTWNVNVSELDESEKTLVSQMNVLREIVELGLSARKESNIKVRQPLEYVAYKSKGEPLELSSELGLILAEELNVKDVHATPEVSEMPETVFKENSQFQILLSIKLTPELKEEGYARELERQVQDLRKKNGLKVGDLIDLYYNTTAASLEMALINKFDRKKTFVVQVKKELEVEPDIEAQLLIEDKAIWVGIQKV
ncbi:MAG: isoleucyl-tRNA synthetase [Candidatus Doudnabacteria bacterium Gr01-1014_77]|uniref:Isoleucine--tRNA ligase n=1 Tax=Candidatus Doudnabacteria bacterium Gr01-1014_77 TaxID=2017133 RepID=A0A554JCK4_9BACT|nr:MAG: isoleucyl-tRNA synthetase [Candidatus Doudnabacteria bacterium Gr01-1014_77]